MFGANMESSLAHADRRTAPNGALSLAPLSLSLVTAKGHVDDVAKSGLGEADLAAPQPRVERLPHHRDLE